MKISKLLTLALLLSVLIISCEDEEATTTETGAIEFRMKYNGNDIELNETLVSPDGYNFKIDRFRFYLSSPEDQISADTFYNIDFSVSNPYTVPATTGSDSIRLGVGLDSDRNATTPADYLVTHPLADSDEYWSGWNSYRFLTIEGWTDLDGTPGWDQAYTYHIGVDQFYNQVTFPSTLGNTTTLNIHIDSILFNPRDPIDFETEFLTHTNLNNPQQAALTAKIMDLFLTSLEPNE